MGRYLDLARTVLPVAGSPVENATLRPTADILDAPVCYRAEPDRPWPDLGRLLPPLAWLTPAQRRLWRERTAGYMADGMPKPAAELEAMAELVMTGKLCDPSNWHPWPVPGTAGCTSPVPDVQRQSENV